MICDKTNGVAGFAAFHLSSEWHVNEIFTSSSNTAARNLSSIARTQTCHNFNMNIFYISFIHLQGNPIVVVRSELDTAAQNNGIVIQCQCPII